MNSENEFISKYAEAGDLGVQSANIHMYPNFLFAAIHHLNRPRLTLSDLVAQSAE